MRLLILLVFISSISITTRGDSYLIPKIQKNIQTNISSIQNLFIKPEIISAILKQNEQHKLYGKKKSLERIDKIDQAWMNQYGKSDFFKQFLNKKCSQSITQSKKDLNYIAEVFVTDNQGAIVCLDRPTSDFWQGDEDKWKIPTKTKKAFLDQPKFDSSAQAFTTQVSTPIFKDDQLIGVLIIGVNLDKYVLQMDTN